MSADNPFINKPTGPIIRSFGGEEEVTDFGTASEGFETKGLFVFTEDEKFELEVKGNLNRAIKDLGSETEE